MPVAEWEGEVEVKGDDMRSRTTYILLFRNGDLDRTNERRRKGSGEERERSTQDLLLQVGMLPTFRKGGRKSLCSFECFCFYFAFPRDGHKMVLYPNQVTRVFAAACFFSVF